MDIINQKQLIVSNAAEINRLYTGIQQSFAERDRSEAERAAWQNACALFHANYFPRLFYPGGATQLQALQQCEPGAIETAVNFLEVDPRYFRSGYIKEYLWHRIVRCPLGTQDIERLHDTALRYTERRIEREFWYMCRAMTRLPDSGFWSAVQARLDADDALRQLRVSYLWAYSKSIEAGECVRRQVYLERLKANGGAG